MATILIVDDHRETVRMLELLIGHYTGHRTITARDGREGVAAAPRADLILMDIQMPELDGIGAYRTLRRDPATASIPIVFMTAFPEKYARRLSGKGGETLDFLSKPIVREELLRRLATLPGGEKDRRKPVPAR